MATKGKRIIHAGGKDECSLLKVENYAVAATTPGLLCRETANGIEIGCAGGLQPLVANINSWKGLTVDDDWVIDETMEAIQPTSGVFMNMRLAASQTIALGDALKDSGSADGYLVKATVATDAAIMICYADEAVTTGAGDAGTMIRVRFS